MKKFLLFILLPFLGFGQTQIGTDILGETGSNSSGWSIGLSEDGTAVAIGAVSNDDNGTSSGQVRVYKNISGSWIQIGDDIEGEAAGDQLGWRVAISSNGNTVATSSPSRDGYAKVYENISNVWMQIGSDINFNSSIDNSAGWSIDLSSDGSIVAIGATRGTVSGFPINSGKVKVYKNVSGVWTQVGEDIPGEAIDDRFGWSVSLSGDGNVVAVGAPDNDGNGTSAGHVRVYENISGVWTQIGDDIDGEASGDQDSRFIDINNVSLSSDGTTVAIGAPFNDSSNGTDSGHVRVYKNVLGVWTQIGDDIDGDAGDFSGFFVSTSAEGSIVAIGSGNSSSGHVRIYKNVSGIWTQIGSDINEMNRVSLSSDGNTLAVGDPTDDTTNGDRSGRVAIYDFNSVLSTNEYLTSQFNIYPNPVKNQFTIELNDGTYYKTINIYNSLGELIKASNQNIVSVTNLSQGVYFVKVETDRGIAIKKIVVE